MNKEIAVRIITEACIIKLFYLLFLSFTGYFTSSKLDNNKTLQNIWETDDVVILD